MTDILGPACDNAVTTRPVRTIVREAIDTWFKDCTESDDGTALPADWFNDMLAQLRTAFINSGIVRDNADDMLWRAIQSAGLRYAVDSSATPNSIIAAFTPPVTSLYGGLPLAVKIAKTNTGAVMLAANDQATKAVKAPDGSDLIAGAWPAGAVGLVIYDGTVYQLLGAPMNVLTGPRVYYVNGATGSDANNGLTAGTAFATLQKAADTIRLYNLNGYNVTVNAANYASYAPVVLPPLNGSGYVSFVGNPGSPSSCAIVAASGPAVLSAGPGYSFNGFKLSSAADNAVTGAPGCGVQAVSGMFSIFNIEFGACATAHMWVDPDAMLRIGKPSVIKLSGGAMYCIAAQRGGVVTYDSTVGSSVSASLVISAPITVTDFYYATERAGITVNWSSVTNNSNVTGRRFNVSMNATLNVAGQTAPGTVAGIQPTGGQVQ
jgi:hypothetical protein